MIVTVVDNNDEKKIIKHIGVVKGDMIYVSYCFLWNGPFRLIYRSANPDNFTAWFLNRNTGIWGCFADALDIGFDRNACIEEFMLELSAKEATDMRSAEKVEDRACNLFFELMTEHIEKLFPANSW